LNWDLLSSNIASKTVTLILDVKSSTNCTVQLYNNSNYLINIVSIPISNNFVTLSASYNVSADINELSMRIVIAPNQTIRHVIYVDNIQMKIQ